MRRPAIVHEKIAIFDPDHPRVKSEKQSTRLAKFQALKALSESRDDEKLQRRGKEILFIASRRNDAEMVKQCAKSGVDINQKEACGSTPLVRAIFAKSMDAIEVLIEKKADPNLLGLWFPLTAAVTNGLYDIADKLIQAGAKINKASKYGRTALGESAMQLDRACAKLLLHHGARRSLLNPEEKERLKHMLAE
jgi:ankyrin repeat protein